MNDENRIALSFEHPNDGETVSAKVPKSMTGRELIRALIDEGFINQGEYELYVKGGIRILHDEILSSQDLEEGDTIRVIPSMKE